MKILNQIKRLLESEWQCTLSSSFENLDEKLSISIGPDEKERPRIIEITVFEQPILSQLGEQNHCYRIQFLTIFPYKVDDLALNDTASLILFLNQLMPYPGFELNELNNQLSYRYAWLIKKEIPDKILLLEILRMIFFSLNLYSHLIEEVSKGRLTFDNVLEKIIKMNEY